MTMERAASDLDPFGTTSGATHGPDPQHDWGSVSLEAEIPEILFEGMHSFIQLNPAWDQYSVITSALAGFLFQNGCQDKVVSQHYLDTLFLRH